jgi:hypothetical protein
MKDLLEHHILETREKFSDIKGDLKDIKERLDDIAVFKLQSIATTRLISLIVSGLTGLLTIGSSLALVWYSRK